MYDVSFVYSIILRLKSDFVTETKKLETSLSNQRWKPRLNGIGIINRKNNHLFI